MPAPAPPILVGGLPAPSDRTPGPVALAAPLHAGTDPSSPFAILTDPPSGTYKAGAGDHRKPATGAGWVWAGVAVMLLAAAALALWLVLGSTSGKTSTTPPAQPANKTKSGR
jgi:hypothetical protein